MKNVTKILFVLICFCLSSCSLQRAATTLTAKIATDGMRAVESETDLWIAKESIVPMVKILEVFRAGDPDNEKFSALMAKVYGNVAFGFFEPKYLSAQKNEKDIWKTRIERYYRLGFESGMGALRKRFGKDAIKNIHKFEQSVGKAKKKDLPLLFWTAFDLGKWVNLNKDDITSVALLPKANAMVERVLALDPDFGCGSALAFKAAMLASRPKMLGGNPEEAARLFEKSIDITDGKYLMNKVMYVEWYAMPLGKKDLARKLLDEIIESDTLPVEGQELANKLAVERAKILRGVL